MMHDDTSPLKDIENEQKFIHHYPPLYFDIEIWSTHSHQRQDQPRCQVSALRPGISNKRSSGAPNAEVEPLPFWVDVFLQILVWTYTMSLVGSLVLRILHSYSSFAHYFYHLCYFLTLIHYVIMCKRNITPPSQPSSPSFSPSSASPLSPSVPSSPSFFFARLFSRRSSSNLWSRLLSCEAKRNLLACIHRQVSCCHPCHFVLGFQSIGWVDSGSHPEFHGT